MSSYPPPPPPPNPYAPPPYRPPVEPPPMPPPYGAYPPPPPRGSSPWGWVAAILVLVLVGGLLCIGLVAALFIGAVGQAMEGFSETGFKLNNRTVREERYVEKILRSGHKGKIIVLPVNGVIDGDGSALMGQGMVGQLLGRLRQAREDSQVSAVILQINSPGGGLTASDLIHHEIKELKAKGKKVVACLGDTAASGGYYIAAPCDKVIASPTSVVGSIGVVMHRFQIDQLMKTIGVKADPIASGASKDLGSPFRELRPEERALLENLVKHFHQRFIKVIAEGRDLPEETVRAFADGSIFNADEAMKKQLVDEIGYFDDALKRTCELAGLRPESATVATYRNAGGIFSLFNMDVEGRGAEPERWAEAFWREGWKAASPAARVQWTGGRSLPDSD